jgi:nucleotide-binding universal stress UspA family protein
MNERYSQMMDKQMKVLIGYDGSRYADAALDDLKRAGLPKVIDVLVVSVGDAPIVPPLASHEIIEKAIVGERLMSIVEHANKEASHGLQQSRLLALKACLRLKKQFPSWRVRGEALSGTPSYQIIRKAGEWNADLIVMGSQGRSAIERFILGSVSLEVARQARCSVRIARVKPGKSSQMEPRIIVGMDGSSGAERAVRCVLERGWPAGTKLRIVAIDDGASAIKIAKAVLNVGEQLRENTPTTTTNLFKVDGTKCLTVTAVIKVGDPRRVLVAEAREWQADCIFIGTCVDDTSHGVFEDCVTTGLPVSAKCSIEIVR